MFPRQHLNYNNVVRCFPCGPCRNVIPGQLVKVSAVQLSDVKWIVLIGELVTELLSFSPCELLLLKAGRWGTETFRQPRRRGTSAVGNRCRATSVKTADWEDLVRSVVNCKVYELAIVLEWHVVTICKCSINPITSPNPVNSRPTR
jgi:hypothetical protein